MDALIMAAGNSTRLYPLTETIPKPLIEIAGKTIIERIMLNLDKAGVNRFVVVVKYLKSKVARHIETLKKKYGFNIIEVEQEEKKGTGMAVYSAKNLLKGDFLVAAGDHILDWRIYKDLIDSYNGEQTVVVKYLENNGAYGEVEIDNGIIKGIKEKPENPKKSYVNLSIYMLNESIFKRLENLKPSIRGEYEITDVLMGMKVLTTNHFWIDIGYYWNVLEAMDFILSKEEEKILGDVKNVEVDGRLIVEEGANIKNAYIKGNVYVGKNTYILPSSYIENSSIEKDSKIFGSVIKQSLIGRGTQVMPSSYITNSVIGNNVNFEPHSKILDTKMNNATIKVNIKNKLINTKRKSLGACIGDNAKIGADAIIMPGKLIKNHSIIKPKQIVYSDIM